MNQTEGRAEALFLRLPMFPFSYLQTFRSVCIAQQALSHHLGHGSLLICPRSANSMVNRCQSSRNWDYRTLARVRQHSLDGLSTGAREPENLPEKQEIPLGRLAYVRCYIWSGVERETGIEPV
jgi:hypothetical protein